MEKLLVILFLIKLYALKNIFNRIGGKHGQNSLTTARNMERTRIKIAKVKADIKFLLVCKRNNLRPTFARPKFAVNLGNRTVNKITKSIIEAELTNKPGHSFDDFRIFIIEEIANKTMTKSRPGTLFCGEKISR